MAATINNFIAALLDPKELLHSLSGATPLRDGEGRVVVSRTKHFADATIEWHQKRYLLSMPLSRHASTMAQYATVKLRALRSTRILEYRMLPDEMSYLDSRGMLRTSELLLQEIPQGESLAKVAQSTPQEQLREQIDALEHELCRLSWSHNNLKAENIILSTADGKLHPTRLHYSTTESSTLEISNSFDTLRSEISSIIGQSLHRSEALYEEPQEAQYGYQYVGNPFEGMCVAESNSGYGYIDSQGSELIPPQYIWAADMREGRAEVETQSGMGLINNKGEYIIDPIYKIVEFNPTTGQSRAKVADGDWRLFDYEGREVVEG